MWAGMNGVQFAELTQTCKFTYISVLSEAIQTYMCIPYMQVHINYAHGQFLLS